MSRVTLILGGIALALLLAFAIIGPASCSRILGLKKQVAVSKGQAEASIDSGREAMNTVSAVEEKDRAADETLKEAIDEIRKAEPGRSNDAALRAACRLRKHRDSKRCAALRGPGSSEPAPAR